MLVNSLFKKQIGRSMAFTCTFLGFHSKVHSEETIGEGQRQVGWWVTISTLGLQNILQVCNWSYPIRFSPWIRCYNPNRIRSTFSSNNPLRSQNKWLLLESFDMIDEKRDRADVRATVHREWVAWYYNIKVMSHAFEIDDLVLKWIFLGPMNMG